jgi:RimJ/RimL family protein N-acetyltransferase
VGTWVGDEAAREVVRQAFGPLSLERIVAVVKPDHVASQRVLEKAGLRHTGTREVYGEQMLLYEADRNGRATHRRSGTTTRARRPSASSIRS